MATTDGPILHNLTIKSTPSVYQFSTGGYKVLYQWLKGLVESLNEWINQNATTINSRPNVGVAADLPPNPPSYSGRSYVATDTKVLYIDDGNGHWLSVNLT